MLSSRKILLWGGRSKARILYAMIDELNLGTPKIIFDTSLKKSVFDNTARFINTPSDLASELPNLTHVAVCIGGEHGFARYETAKQLTSIGLSSLSIVHPHSFIDPSAKLGEGCQVMPGSVIHKFVEIGDHVIINTSATIDHECILGHGVHVMGSAAIAGRVKIGNYVTIGTNATILPDIEIKEGAYIGAGAVVTKNVESNSVVTGIPARAIKARMPKFDNSVFLSIAKLQTDKN